MDVIDLRPDLRFLRNSPGQAYLLRRAAGVALIDTGRPGDGDAIDAALRDWGLDHDALPSVLLTHWHSDHTGSAADIGAWPGVRILAHRDDAPIIRGERTGLPPVFTPAELALHAQSPATCPTPHHPGSITSSTTPTSSTSSARPSVSCKDCTVVFMNSTL